MQWYLKVLKQYAVFEGRARRKEYWMFTLFQLIIICALMFGGMAFVSERTGEILYTVYVLATFLPSLGVSIRRLHDVDKSGWWLLISFITFGSLYLLYLYVCEGTQGENRFGPDSKAEENAAI